MRLMFNLQDAYGANRSCQRKDIDFRHGKGTIDVKTYVVYANQFLQDQNNQFTLDTSFYNSAANIPEFPVGVVVVVLLF